jgi:cysteine-rich repeat protein
MWVVLRLVVLVIVATLTACGDGANRLPPEQADASLPGGADGGVPGGADGGVPVCGNGLIDPGEACDDGNATDGDGCDSHCTRGTLAQLHYVKASNTGGADEFGISVALSADGSTMAVGAINEDSSATGVGGDQFNDDARDSGAVYVYTHSGQQWNQQAYIKASVTGFADSFGLKVALSADGSTLAVGAPLEDSAATGIDGVPTNDAAEDSGAVYVYTRSGTMWTQQAYIKASNTGRFDNFGLSLSLSADGSTLAVGAQFEASAATGIGGDQSDDSRFGAGAVYVFTRAGTTWNEQAYIKASATDFNDLFGCSVSLSNDGATLAVGAEAEDGGTTGIGGDPDDDSAPNAGAAYVFTRNNTAWSQQAYVKASNTGAEDIYGFSVALAGDGATLAVGAPWEASAATGIDGPGDDNSVGQSGAVYVYTRSGAAWSQQAYVKASNAKPQDFGWSVALSNDGSMLLVGAPDESSASPGIDGDQSDRTAGNAGAAYLFSRTGTRWAQQHYIKASNPDQSDQFGHDIALSSDASTLVVGAFWESGSSTGIDGLPDNNAYASGAVYVFQ